MNDIAVRVEGLGKRFSLKAMAESTLYGTLNERICALQNRFLRRGSNDSDAAKLAGLGKGEGTSDEFWALKDINFELKHGEVLGIIGQNGAGKSTLLKILAQVLAPTTGRAELHGRVGALLEVGTGFNPELSGRENIHLYGSILGMSRADISKRFDEIVEFAEIAQFLDQPIKHYSSGMHSRLGFSVAAHLQCDILLVDEVLSVGDAAFRAKCLGKMQDVTGQGRAVIFVSHNMSAINNMCDHGIVLQKGQIDYQGNAQDATAHYMSSVMPTSENRDNPIEFAVAPSKPAQVRRCVVSNDKGMPSLQFERAERIFVETVIDITTPSLDYYAAVAVHDSQGNCLIHALDEDEHPSQLAQAGSGQYRVSVALPGGILRVGRYSLTVGIGRRQDGRVDKHDNLLAFEVRDSHSHGIMRGNAHIRNLIAPILDWQVSAMGSPPLQSR